MNQEFTTYNMLAKTYFRVQFCCHPDKKVSIYHVEKGQKENKEEQV